ncbi:hypothetical protein [Candidatus Hodarchaeum mangrovi]
MHVEKTKKILNYDGPITFGEGAVMLILPEDLHNWVMENVPSKYKRAEFIRSRLRLLMEGQVTPHLASSPKQHLKTLEEIKSEIQIKKKAKTLNELEKRNLERQEALIGVNEELKILFAARAASSSTS